MNQFEGLVGRKFQFMTCWNALKNTRKWQDWLSLQRTGAGASNAATDEPHGQDDSPATDTSRPIGRDAAKKRRSEGAGTSSESAIQEVFERMAVTRERKSQEEAARAARSEESMQLQLQLQQEQLRGQLELNRLVEEKIGFISKK